MIHLGTRCGSIDEFVERFAPFATETSLVMPALNDVRAGTEGRFVIRLKDQSAVMSGRCRVEEVKPVAATPPGAASGRLVMRVRLLDMDDASRNVHRQLLACKRAAPPPPVAAPKPPPLRIVRAPTLIGTAPAPIGTAATLIGTAAPPAPVAAAGVPAPIPDDAVEKTMPSPFRAPESHAPPGTFTLPANPLSDLEAGDLASFIECTLFEADEAGEASDGAKTPLVEVAPAQAVRSDPRAESSSIVGASETTGPQTLLRRRLMQAAPYALCTVIGVLAGSVLRGSPARAPSSVSPRTPPATAAAAPPATAAATPPATAAAAAPASATPPSAPIPVVPPTPRAPELAPPAPAPAKAAPATPTGARACSASVTTEPPDAVVLWGTQPLGRTPVRNATIPCGPATLTLQHERYRDVSRAVTGEPGRALVVSERLHRPMGTLFLSSSPARATFKVNEQRLGPGPRKLDTWRFETVHVEATLPGYQPWSKTLYLKEPITKLNAQLASLSKPDARAAARPAARR